MSVNITVAVPLDAIAAIKSGNSGSTMGAALSATSRAVVAAVLALPYDIKSSTSSEDNDATQTDGGVEGGKSAAFALAQSHLDDTFTITVMHRAEAKPAAVIRVHGSTKVGQLAQLIQDETEVSKYLQYLVYDHKLVSMFVEGKFKCCC